MYEVWEWKGGTRVSRLVRALPVIGALMIAAGAVHSAPKVGAKPADVTVQDLSGKPVKLSTLRAGKPVLVNFWATW
jgi:cytochrome oxidase Cu insertion factor (SCO1/SenC/PrrC family)